MFILLEFEIDIMHIDAFEQCFGFVFFREDVEDPHVDVDVSGVRFAQVAETLEQFPVQPDQVVAGIHGHGLFAGGETGD
jgi:hypothetical protein